MRSTQEWLEYLEDVKEYALSQHMVDPYSADSINGLNSSLGGSSANTGEVDRSDRGVSPDVSGGPPHRKMLQKNNPAGGDDDSLKGRKRFSKRHSKHGLAAVF